jgi:hypothetical protein
LQKSVLPWSIDLKPSYDFEFRDDALPGATYLSGWYAPDAIEHLQAILTRHQHLSALVLKVDAAERAWKRLGHPEGPIVVEKRDLA